MKTIIAIFLTGMAALQAQEAGAQVKVFETRVSPLAGPTLDFVAGELVGGSPVSGVPYSAQAVNETTQILADGNRIARSSSSMLYRDNAGRERREETLPSLGASGGSSQPLQTVFISDPVAGVSYTLDLQTHTARKMTAPSTSSSPLKVKTVQKKFATGGAVAGGMMWQGGIGVTGTMAVAGVPGPTMVYAFNGNDNGGGLPAPKVEQLGSTTIEGVAAEGTRTTITIPAGQIGNVRAIDIVSERWYSSELQMTIQSKQSDPRSGETTYKLTNINRSEPLHSLFEPPPDYTLETIPAFKFENVRVKPEE